jgi:hypothetical protein
MKPADLLEEMVARLTASGVRLTERNGELQAGSCPTRFVLDAFVEVARLPADERFENLGATCVVTGPDSDLLLFESSSIASASFSLTRQLTAACDDVEDELMSRLLVNVEIAGDPPPSAAREVAWGRGGPSGERGTTHSEIGDRWTGNVDEWAARVAASNTVSAALAAGQARVRVGYGPS